MSPIRFALFYDAGFVNRGAYDFNVARYHDNFGFGLRLFVAGAPLSLDFGIPIMKEETDSKRLFTFSIDVPFK